ncbi:MAG: L-fucokinase [Bryobacteraceae bacterium]|jgi:galactokinase/mevalonate kinase-like predicted kinase
MAVIPRLPEQWDYLILTASNAVQAEAYERQLGLRRELGLLPQVRDAMVVADLEGRRIGSGGSTLYCLAVVLNRERQLRGIAAAGWDALEEILRGLRILILHAGGDSRRLPAYAPCGKVFVPVPGESHSALAPTMFDRLAPSLLDLPAGAPGRGQVVVAAGDALIRFDPSWVEFAHPGMTMLGCYASPEEAARHGVFSIGAGGVVRLYLQKPGIEEQKAAGAIDRHGRTVLDVAITSLDAAAATGLLRTFEVAPDESGALALSAGMRDAILAHGLDLYREICCAMGTEATLEHYLGTARGSGSRWEDGTLEALLPSLRKIPFHVQVLPQSSFLHFGSTRQLISSGLALTVHDRGVLPEAASLSVNNEIWAAGAIRGRDSWVEGCRLGAPLSLAGRNVVIGVDVAEPVSLPEGACLEVVAGRGRGGAAAWFVRCYGIEDTFKNGEFCGRPLLEWLSLLGVAPEAVWGREDRNLWNARLFPAEREHAAYHRWLWMFAPREATAEQRAAFLAADRYSCAEIALLADQDAFHARRARIRAAEVRGALRGMFSRESPFSAADLAFVMRESQDRGGWAADVLALAQAHLEESRNDSGLEGFTFCRIMHSLATAVSRLAGDDEPLSSVLPGLNPPAGSAGQWRRGLEDAAFHQLSEIVLASRAEVGERPRNALRPDETIWGRGPARIELGGGWTDTPPYSLEYGGDVTNVAINLNGQPPIHCYCRVIDEPVIRLSSIDGGTRIEIRELDELLDFRCPGDRFALSKAALAISGFSPQVADWPAGIPLRGMLEEFGGGIELTCLVGIPKGSGLGTSSILGAVIMAVIRRLLGREQNQREIFHEVLRLEQALTTGGGWQDQAGGIYPGAKITSTRPGIFPDPLVHYIPADLLDPKSNGGSTLLYYTGMTRLAKDILAQVVASFLNRDRRVMRALAEEHLVAHSVADAMARKDAAVFGHYVDAAWELQKRLCADVTNEAIESLLARMRPFVHGMRISGAGSGGFLLMICKSPRHAAEAREELEREPLNERARFFDYEINHAGLEVTTC